MIRTWMELYDMDISAYTKKRDKIEYLPWNNCLKLLYEVGAQKVEFVPLYNKDGHSVFVLDSVMGYQIEAAKGTRAKDPLCPEVHVRVVVDDLSGDFAYPVINGIEVITMGKINQQLVNAARQRAFVKGVAIMTGLGLKLWEQDESEVEAKINKEAHNVQVCANRIAEKYALAVKRVGSEAAVLEQLSINGVRLNAKQLKAFMGYLGSAAVLEHQLERVR